MPAESGPPVGRVVGTEDSTPLEFWVGIEEALYGYQSGHRCSRMEYSAP